MKKSMLSGLVLLAALQGAHGLSEDGIFSYRVGRFEVYLFVEAERDGNAGILVGADEEILQRFIPEEGFRHTTNAVLIRTRGAFGRRQNVLIDAGTGRQGVPISEQIKKVGVQPNQINTVLISHLHLDHFGGLVVDGEAVFTRAQIHVPQADYNWFTRESPNETAVSTLQAYGNRVSTFTPGELGSRLRRIAPGITPIAAFGHTPGHTVFLIEDRRQQLLFISDLLHLALVQFAVPEISATFDMDPEESARRRRQFLNFAAQNNIPIAGSHIVYPGLGRVEVLGEGFRFIPEQ
jgi:glyoxylase-like metal-dependent hydrolase (beta-lactamase superfamily II)